MSHGPDVMRTPESTCLHCGARLDAIGTADPNKPAQLNPGEMLIVVCIKCGAVMTLNAELRIRGFTDKEMDELQRDRATMNQLARLVKGVHLLRHLKG